MRIMNSLLIIGMSSVLASCSMNSAPIERARITQKSPTDIDHESLARHYEGLAKDMQARAQAHRTMLAEYEGKTERNRLYKEQLQSLISHSRRLIRTYEQVASENMALAIVHRQLATEGM